MPESFLCFVLASPSSNPLFSGHARFAFPRTRGKPRDEQGWKRILKETTRVRVFIFRRRLRGACATSDGPGFRFRQRTSCIPMRRYRSARWVWRMLVTTFFFWYLLLFRLEYNWNEPSIWTMLPVFFVSTFGCVILARNVYRTRD